MRNNSGWECNAAEMDGIWYRREDNVIHEEAGKWLTDEADIGLQKETRQI